jgi:hypothetical protein
MPLLRRLRLARLRRSAPALTALPLLLLVSLMSRPSNGYWPDAAANATAALYLLVPCCAALAAWETGRLRRGGIERLSIARSPVMVAYAALRPVLLLGLLGVVAAVANVNPPWGEAPGAPVWAVLGMMTMVLVGWIALGGLLGRILHGLVALPLCLVGGWLWIGWTVATLSPPWLRNLAGRNLEFMCCEADEVPDTGAVLGPALLAAGVLVMCLCVLPVRHRALAWLTAVAVLVPTVALASAQVDQLGVFAAAERMEGLSCSGKAPRICLWPEQRESAEQLSRVYRKTYRTLEAAGVELPDSVSASSVASLAGTDAVVYVGPEMYTDDDSAALLLAQSLVPDSTICGLDSPGVLAKSALGAWLALTAGVSAEEVAASSPEADFMIAERVRSVPMAQQLAWYEFNTATLTTKCGTKPRSDIRLFVAAAEAKVKRGRR